MSNSDEKERWHRSRHKSTVPGLEYLFATAMYGRVLMRIIHKPSGMNAFLGEVGVNAKDYNGRKTARGLYLGTPDSIRKRAARIANTVLKSTSWNVPADAINRDVAPHLAWEFELRVQKR